MKASRAGSKHFFIMAAPLFLVLFMDSVGLGLVFPILNSLIVDPRSHFLKDALGAHQRNALYGITVSIFMFCCFFGSAFLGELSDKIGRKKSLVICLWGAAAGYLVSAIGVVIGSYALLLIGRMVAGFTSGSQVIAQAAIVDISEPSQKARNIALILFFCSLGFAIGPVMGGVLSAKQLVSWFDYTVPLYFAAIVSIINAVALILVFKETFSPPPKKGCKWYYAIEIFMSAFRQEKIRNLSIVLLLMLLGWGGFYSFVSMYMLQVYHFTALQNGLYMGLLGVGFGIGSTFVGSLTKRFSLTACSVIGTLLTACFTLMTIAIHSPITPWFFIVGIGMSMAVAYSTILTLFSNKADENSQGLIMGITGSICAFSFAISGFFTGLFSNISAGMPLGIAGSCFVVSALCMMMVSKRKG